MGPGKKGTFINAYKHAHFLSLCVLRSFNNRSINNSSCFFLLLVDPSVRLPLQCGTTVSINETVESRAVSTSMQAFLSTFHTLFFKCNLNKYSKHGEDNKQYANKTKD